MAMKFLSDPRTIASTSSRAQKEQFLRTKGLTDAEISKRKLSKSDDKSCPDAAFQRLDVSLAMCSCNQCTDSHCGEFRKLSHRYFPPQQPLPPQEPAWLSLTKAVIGTGAALMAGWWLFNRSRQDRQHVARHRQEHVENVSVASERDKLLTELLARERQRGSGSGEVSDKSKEVEPKQEDRLMKMLEEMQKQQMKQHADLIMTLKEMTAARNGGVEQPRGSRKAGGIVLDDEEEYESIATPVEAEKCVEPQAQADSTVDKAVDLEALAEEMDDRMRGTVKMLLGNLIKNPKSDKFRRVNIRTPRFQAQLEESSLARKFMEQLGFREDGSYLVWSPLLSSNGVDELGEVKRALSLVSNESVANKESGTVEEKKSQASDDISAEESTASDTSKRSPLPWMSSAVAATAAQ
ncbi:hypothetical protein FOL47_008305, partial [Perkinsus chesapeaki]